MSRHVYSCMVPTDRRTYMSRHVYSCMVPTDRRTYMSRHVYKNFDPVRSVRWAGHVDRMWETGYARDGQTTAR
jgi:hypothetical protein